MEPNPALHRPADCQLEDMPAALVVPTAAQRLLVLCRRAVKTLAVRARKPLRDPAIVRRKLATFVRRRSPKTVGSAFALDEVPARFQPGELVRIKSAEAIRATLDSQGRFQGLAYMALVMDPYCGRVCRVVKRVDRFFDEKRWLLLTLKDVVILDGVFCEPPRAARQAYAGCDRTCFLFWKEAWLERAAPPDGEPRDGSDR